MTTIRVCRAADRAVTRTPWLESRHSFSYGAHYDPRNTHFGRLLVHNDDVVQPGHGFDDHAHADVEIVSWVVDGALEHRHGDAAPVILRPGEAQYLRAGRRVVHAERNADPSRPLRFVQAWLAAGVAGAGPAYRAADVSTALTGGEPVAVASGDDAAAPLRLSRAGTALWAWRPGTGQQMLLPAAPFVHVYLVRGAVAVEGVGRLAAGDAARLQEAPPVRLRAEADAELLAWTMSGLPWE